MSEPLVRISFTAPVTEWRGPAPYFFATIPDDQLGEVRHAARLASYGWGCVPVTVTIGNVEFRTSLFPKDETYLVPLRADVRQRAGIVPGRPVTATLVIFGTAQGEAEGRPARLAGF